DWNSEFFPESGNNIVAKFAINKTVGFSLDAVSIDNFSEDTGINAKVRIHNSSYPSEYTVETASIIPNFNTKVFRTFEITNNFFQIITDVQIANGICANSFSVDQMQLTENWNLDAVLLWDEKSNLPFWQKKPESFKSGTPFLSALFSCENRILEIGTGDDLWRWINSRSVENAKSMFSIKKENAVWKIRRKLLLYKEKSIFPCKNMRLSSYFFISDPNKRKGLNDNLFNDTELNLTDSIWNDDSKISWRGVLYNSPCWFSNSFRKRIKKTIRTLHDKKDIQTVSFSGIELFICDSASHLNRGNNKKLPHWNILEINKFRKWANRQLLQKGIKINLIPRKDSVASYLPSLSL
ncbi:MAG TPA: hypothetical protein PLN24_09845, partial [Victivallales bacterium]|nr:hypothetical protein [Victivallales bacterium]